MIDEEVRSIIDTQYTIALDVLKKNRDILSNSPT